MLGASYFGNWNDNTNNLLRALLCTPNYGYISMYAVHVNWHFQPSGQGDPVGFGLPYTLNSVPYASGHKIYMTLLGDPTLRLQTLLPPTAVEAQIVTSKVHLKWEPPRESGVRYLVYRSTNGIGGQFVRLGSGPVATTVFVDESPPSGVKLYKIRATKLISTGSGSFTNISQGTFIQVN
jgi:hypothetical protein